MTLVGARPQTAPVVWDLSDTDTRSAKLETDDRHQQRRATVGPKSRGFKIEDRAR